MGANSDPRIFLTTDYTDGHGSNRGDQVGMEIFQKETEETEKTFPRMTRMNADKSMSRSDWDSDRNPWKKLRRF